MQWKKYDQMSDKRTFIGQIVTALDGEGTFTKDGKTRKTPQIHIEVKPLDHEIKGPTGCYHEWLPITDAKKSKIGEWTKRLEELGINLTKTEDMIGIIGEFENVDFDFGTADKPYIVEGVLMLKRLTDEQGNDVGTPAQAPEKPKAGFAAIVKPVQQTSAPVIPGKKTYNFSELETKLKGEDGFSRDQVTKWARKNGIPKVDLDNYMADLGDKLQADEYDILHLTE